MAPRHHHRFANQALPAHVLDDPLAFARAMADPRTRDAMLLSVWARAGASLPVADRQPPAGLTAAVNRAAPYAVILVEPPFPREIGDACAIAVVGRGDATNDFDDPRYFVLELGADPATGATRLVLVSHPAHGERRTIAGAGSPDLPGFVDQCVALAAGVPPAPRDRAPAAAPWYWWHVVRGVDAMRGFGAAPEREAWDVVHRYPILLLPEVVDAADQVLGGSPATEGLRQMHRSLRGTPYFVPFHRILATALGNERAGSQRVNLERALAVIAEVRATVAELGAHGSEAGRVDVCEATLREQLAAIGVDPRHNYEAALALLEAARAQPADPAEVEADERTARAIRAALGGLAGPLRTADPAWTGLFLEGSELQGFQRCADRTDASPQPEDRAFTQRGGLVAGAATWLGSDAAPVHRLVDTRWLFPSVKTASAFVQAILPITGEGLASVPMTLAGDAAYGWSDIRPVREPATHDARQIVVVRVGRMVAKLHVTEGPRASKQFQALAPARVVPYVEAIVRRGRRALARYWLAVARGVEAANRFVETPPRGATQLFAAYPILLLPEFPTAMASLGEPHGAAAEALSSVQARFKNNWQAYRDVLRALVRTLLDEPDGEPVVNADAALALVVDHRRLDHDYSWAAIEAECRARV